MEGRIIGNKLDECLICGNAVTNRHHVVPESLKPKHNVTVPLCDEHKDALHPTIMQFYFPKGLRDKIGKINKLCNNLNGCAKSLKEDLK